MLLQILARNEVLREVMSLLVAAVFVASTVIFALAMGVTADDNDDHSEGKGLAADANIESSNSSNVSVLTT